MACNAELAQTQNAVEVLAYFFDEVHQLCEIEITPDIFNELIFSNECYLTEQAIKQKIADDLQRAGIRIKSIKGTAELQGLEDFYKLYNQYRFKRSTFVSVLHNLAIEQNRLIAKPGLESELKEKYSMYVRSKAGQALRVAHLKYVEVANEFFKQMPETKRNLIAQSWDFDNENDNLKAREWDYDFLTKVV